jgi:hypothetical protein
MKLLLYNRPTKFGQFRLPEDNWSNCEQTCVLVSWFFLGHLNCVSFTSSFVVFNKNFYYHFNKKIIKLTNLPVIYIYLVNLNLIENL